jgi:translation initiation factor IF-1
MAQECLGFLGEMPLTGAVACRWESLKPAAIVAGRTIRAESSVVTRENARIPGVGHASRVRVLAGDIVASLGYLERDIRKCRGCWHNVALERTRR